MRINFNEYSIAIGMKYFHQWIIHKYGQEVILVILDQRNVKNELSDVHNYDVHSKISCLDKSQ